MMNKQAILFDRDGVLNQRRTNDYVKSIKEFIWCHGALDSLQRLYQVGYPLFIITNQAGIGKGIFTFDQLNQIHRRLYYDVLNVGAKVEQIYVCPHTPEDCCNCRKPQPGLLLQAAKDYKLDLLNSIFIGDSESDITAGNVAGCITILLDSCIADNEYQPHLSTTIKQSDYHFPNLFTATDYILSILERKN